MKHHKNNSFINACLKNSLVSGATARHMQDAWNAAIEHAAKIINKGTFFNENGVRINGGARLRHSKSRH